LLCAAAAAVPALAQTPATPLPATFEAQLTFDQHYAEGEPSIAVNPTNPKNIIVTFLANTGFGTYGLQNGQPPTVRDYKQTIQGCDYVVTSDGGRTWTRKGLPITNFEMDPTRPQCSDTLVLFDRHGVAYVIGSAFQFPTFATGQGDFRVISSRDGGRTWTKPSVVSPTLLSPGSDVRKWQGARFYDDREFMALDESTHTLYVNGTQGRADAHGSVGDMEYLTASDDGGKTWRDALAVGVASPSPLAAAFGTVAFTSPAPTGAKRACTCFDFIVSTDHARSVVRRPSPVPASSTPTGLLSSAVTAADPTHAAHFAVLTSDSAGHVLVYRTADAGRSWAAPVSFAVADRGVSKAWMEYSRSGVLGIGWRATQSDGSYGFYGAASYDGGTTFSVKRISRADSPPNDRIWVAGDDTSAMTIANGRLYATWGDWRGGSLQTWWGGFPLKK
jgi:photosystem II stability/assembly factor-like uncharacterized protein